jgi:putative transposase
LLDKPGVKPEYYHRSMKNVIKLQNYDYPWVMERSGEDCVDFYNNHRYHEPLGNLTPVDVYFGRVEEVISRREKNKEKTFQIGRVEDLQQLCV